MSHSFTRFQSYLHKVLLWFLFGDLTSYYVHAACSLPWEIHSRSVISWTLIARMCSWKTCTHLQNTYACRMNVRTPAQLSFCVLLRARLVIQFPKTHQIAGHSVSVTAIQFKNTDWMHQKGQNSKKRHSSRQ